MGSRRFPGRVRRTNKVFKPFTPPRFILNTGNSTIQEFALDLSTPLADINLNNSASNSFRCNTSRSGTLGIGKARKPIFNFETSGIFRDRYSSNCHQIYGKSSFPIRSVEDFHFGKQADNGIKFCNFSSSSGENETLDVLQKSTIIPRNQPILSTSILPEKYLSIFSFSHFNKMQSESFETIYNSDCNCVINAPTGSGKTVLFELAMLRIFFYSNMNNKVLYLAPSKALCAEKYKDWVSKFSFLSITVGVLTSETSLEEAEGVKRSNIIISTPEKLDLLTRKLSNYDKL